MTPEELAKAAHHLLVDFDGPVCAVFGGLSDREVAEALRDELKQASIPYPADVATTRDPFVVLAFASGVDEAAATRIDQVFRRYEIQAVESAPATDGASAFLRRAHGRGQAVSIVSNNSAVAVGHYLERRALSGLVDAVSARQDAVVGRLKPSPYLLEQAMRAAGTPPSACLMIGDSATDIEAARTAGTGVVAFANKPGKREVFAALRPDAIITAMTQL